MTSVIFLSMFLMLLVSLGMIINEVRLPVFAAVNDFDTDKDTYHKGDQMRVSGTVSFDPDIPFVTIQIFTPSKSGFAVVNTIPVNTDGSFSVVFIVGGPTWSLDGIYPIKVTYDGNLEKSVEYLKIPVPESKNTQPTPKPRVPDPPANDTTPKPRDPDLTANDTPKLRDPVPTTNDTSPKPQVPDNTIKYTPNTKTVFETLKFKIPNFPALDKTPQHYIDRYNAEPAYKSWFDSQFPSHSIVDVVGYGQVSDFPALDKTPQHYIDRYNTEPTYKSWFDSQFTSESIYNVLGYADPVPIPDWIKDNAGRWATGAVNDDVFASGIEFMLANNIIMVSNVPFNDGDTIQGIPIWMRDCAHWWSRGSITETEFVNSVQFIIAKGVITVN